jgi:hypothetical protein
LGQARDVVTKVQLAPENPNVPDYGIRGPFPKAKSPLVHWSKPQVVYNNSCPNTLRQ